MSDASPSLDLQKLAILARIELTDDELARFAPQLEKVLGYIEKLEELDVDGIEPTAHAAPVFDVMREDVSRPGFGAEKALQNAPKRAGDQFQVAKVIEEA
ncbi:MAG: Asp-tRNA(Asn)/Glu-tRNA(Gln) amidotransferase subunit GatC [Verrucomicrobiota bacterium]